MMIGDESKRWAFSTDLSQEELKTLLIYDPISGIFTWKDSGKEAGSIKNCYIYIQVKGHQYPAHVLAWFYVHGTWSLIDHKDNTRSNNALLNLRPTTHQLNAANRTFTGNNSGYKGVYRKGSKFEVGIKVNQRRIYLGLFNSAEEASEAYEQAAKKYFGEFANTGKAEAR